jgi:hypothetical protein
MTEWTNPYNDFQHSLREILNDRLRRTNGCVTREQFMECALPGLDEKAEKMRLRLFSQHSDGRLEWKPEIMDEQDLIKKVGGSAAIRQADLITLWSQSRKLSLRTAYPKLAPVGKKTQHVSRNSFSHAPVFGVDVLVRPPTVFSEDRDDKSLHNGLVLGEECIALVIHGTFENGRLVEDGEYFARLVVGDAFTIPKVSSLISPAAGLCENAIRASLQKGDATGTVDALLPHLNSFAEASSMAFIS